MQKKILKFGVLSLALCTTFIAGVGASNLLEPISAYLNHGITVEYNDVDQNMVDANGQKVIPITYNGSTYLPVRAVSNMLGVAVNWDAPTQTVLLGNSYPDAPVVQPVTPVIPPVTPTANVVVPEITSNQFDITWIFDLFDKYAPGKYSIDEFSQEQGEIVGKVLQGTPYDGGDGGFAYAFYGAEFRSKNYGGDLALDTIEKEIENILLANGYKLATIDEFGQKHYTKGITEIKVWDILGDNGSLRISADTKWLGCHLGY